MPLRLYNTRTRSVEPFAPLRGKDLRIYVCGLTPSAEAHIGHARSFLFFDVLRRYLEQCGYRVTYVQNVTDIDDRSIERAKQTGENWHDIVSGLYATFKVSMRKLEVRDPDEEPYATKFIPQIVAMIEELVARGYAYATKGGVYYRVARFERYGQLSNRKVDELQAGARIEVDEFKDDPLDFALWKFAKPGEPAWPSPWGEGRPGWHIECSAMARTLLDPEGTGFDIHGGGADLIFPHHENEIAQSEPLMAKPPMANFWLHGGLLLSDNKKMAKSIGNFEPLSELLARHDPQAIRLLFLQTGYRKVMNFNEEAIAAATVSLRRLKHTYAALKVARYLDSGTSPFWGRDLMNAVKRCLDDDMNTAAAVAELHKFADAVDQMLPHGVLRDVFDSYDSAMRLLGISPNDSWLQPEQPADLPEGFVQRLQSALGAEYALSPDPEDAIEHVLQARKEARARKDWETSDRLRDALLQCGVELQDSQNGTTWSVATLRDAR